MSCSTRSSRWRSVFTCTCSAVAVSCQRHPDERNRSSVSTSRERRRASCSSSGRSSALPERRQHLLVLERQQKRVRAHLVVRRPPRVAPEAGEAAGVAGLDDGRAQAGRVGRQAADADRLVHALVHGGGQVRQAGLVARPAGDRDELPRLHGGDRPHAGVGQRALEPVKADVGILRLAHDRRQRRGRVEAEGLQAHRRRLLLGGARHDQVDELGREPALVLAQRLHPGELEAEERQRLVDGGAVVVGQARAARGHHEMGLRPADGDDRKGQPAVRRHRRGLAERGRLGTQLGHVPRLGAARDHAPPPAEHPRLQARVEHGEDAFQAGAVAGRVHEPVVAQHPLAQGVLALAVHAIDERARDGDERHLERHGEQGQPGGGARRHEVIRHDRVGLGQPVAERGDVALAQRRDEAGAGGARIAPDARRQDHLAALQVAGGVGQLGGVHPADDAFEVAVDHDPQVE